MATPSPMRAAASLHPLARQIKPRGPRRTLLRGSSALTAAGLIAGALAGHALAAPTGGTVVEGSAEIVQVSPNTIEIRQQSDKVIIEWQSFDIAEGETVSFIQPGDFAAALNRVLSGQASAILGNLNANGKIVITNPAGITFGPQARVDVASIVASALGITNDNFLSGKMIFDQPGDPRAVVANQGKITAAEGGLAALVAPGVKNSGVIAARLGTVALAAGNAVTLDFYGDGLVQIAVHEPVREVPVGVDGQPVQSLVDQQGGIYADGGTVVLTAAAAEGVLDRVINVDGITQAQSIESRQGQIAFVGTGAGEVNVAGAVDASGKDAGEKGGTVHVLGKQVTLADGASVDVTGDAGGGTVLIGGDKQGGGPHVRTSGLAYVEPASEGGALAIALDEIVPSSGYIPQAQVTYVAEGVTIGADAVTSGDGGKVVAFSHKATDFAGAVSARGGEAGGDGGFVEVSGLDALSYRGTVDTRAPKGATGVLLFDPQFVQIVDGVYGAGAQDGSLPFIGPQAPPATFVITNGALVDYLETSNVQIAATDTISVLAKVDASANNAGAGAGDLTLLAPTIDLGDAILLQAGKTLTGNATTVNVLDDDASIQQAIGLVVAGGTVNVAAGTYAESLVIDKSLALLGDAGDAVTPGAAATAPLLQGSGAGVGITVAHSATDVTITGFRLDDFTNGVVSTFTTGSALAGTTIDVSNNTFTNIGNFAIGLDEFASIGVTYNAISASANGLFLQDFDAATVTGNLITAGAAGSGVGLNIADFGGASADGMATTLRQNVIAGFGIGVAVGAVPNGTTSLTAEQNVISGSSVGVWVLSQANGALVHLSGNDLSGNTPGSAVLHLGSGTVDASGNWWGSADESTVAASVLGSVDVTPYLASNTDRFADGDVGPGLPKFLDGSDPATGLGFQGDFSHLFVTALKDQVGATGRVQEAVNLLADGALLGGDRLVQVNDGIYAENVVVTRSMTLLGDPGDPLVPGAASATLLGNGTGNGVTVNLPASDVTIAGFHINNFDIGIRATLSNNTAVAGTTIDVNNNTLTNIASYGLALSGYTDMNVAYNQVSGLTGMLVSNFGKATILGNVIDGVSPGLGVGVYLADGLTPDTMETYLRQNVITDYAAKVWVFGGVSLTAEQNAMSGNAGGNYGVVLFAPADGDRVTLFDNDLSGYAPGRAVYSLAPGTVDASGNWWGSADPVTAAGAYTGGVAMATLLASGTDTDVPTAFLDGTWPAAPALGFQGGDVISASPPPPPPPPAAAVPQLDFEQRMASYLPLHPGADPLTPGDAAYRFSELNNAYAADLLGAGYAIGDTGLPPTLDALAPGGPGATLDLCLGRYLADMWSSAAACN